MRKEENLAQMSKVYFYIIYIKLPLYSIAVHHTLKFDILLERRMPSKRSGNNYKKNLEGMTLHNFFAIGKCLYSV